MTKLRFKHYPNNPSDRQILAEVFLFGGGLDSLTILELMVDGAIKERPDVIIFSDTNAEPPWVYQNMLRARENARLLGIPFVTVVYDCTFWTEYLFIDSNCHASPPFWLDTGKDKPGRLRRQCTDYYKIKPSQRYTKLWLHEQGLLKFKIDGGGWGLREWYISPFPKRYGVCTWVGYTTDENNRIWDQNKISWQIPYYPLIDLGMTRDDCKDYWESKGLRPPSRSSCIFCPNRSDDEWIDMKERCPFWFEEACSVDDRLRSTEWSKWNPFYKIKAPMYVHSSRKPLREVFR